MAFSGNFYQNKEGIINFLTAYNGMQPRSFREIHFNAEARNLYDLLYLELCRTPFILQYKCEALVKLITPCLSGESGDPLRCVDQGDASEDGRISAAHVASDADFSDSVSVGGDPGESQASFVEEIKEGQAFILSYLKKLAEEGYNPDWGGVYMPYDPVIAKKIAEQDAPPLPRRREYSALPVPLSGQRIVFYYANFSDSSNSYCETTSGASAAPPPPPRVDENDSISSYCETTSGASAAPPPPPRVDANDPAQQAIKAAEEFEKFKSSWAIAGWELALAAEHKKESRKAWTNNLLSLSILPVGFGVGAAIGFGVVKLGIAAIGIAGISFPPILLIGAVVAVTAAIAYCCIKKYKKSPIFTKKQRPTIPPENAMVFSAPALNAPGKIHYNRFRAFFESMHQKFSQPITDKITPSWKKIQACLDDEAKPEWDEAKWLTNLRNNLKTWKEEEAADGADRDQIFSKYFGRIMWGASHLRDEDLPPDAGHYLKIRSALEQELLRPCTKDILSFYADFKENNRTITGRNQLDISGLQREKRLRALRPYAAENPLPQPRGV